MPPRDLVRSILVNIAFTLAGCAISPKASLEAGEAKLMAGTVTVDVISIKGIVEVKGKRTGVQTYISDCRNGHGNLRVDAIPYAEYVPNVVASQTSPADRVFSELCQQGLPIAVRDEAERARRFAAMTPEEREAQRRALRELFLMQQSQQSEAARNASRERAAESIGSAIRDSSKTTTTCTASTPWYVKCETK